MYIYFSLSTGSNTPPPRHDDNQEVDIQRKKSLKNLKKYAKKFIIFFITLVTAFVAIALVYFYLEHCFDPQQIEGQTNHLWQLCQHMLDQTNNITNNNTNTNITRLINICKDVSQPAKIKCEFTKTNFLKYFDLAGHIAFTVGIGNCFVIYCKNSIELISCLHSSQLCFDFNQIKQKSFFNDSYFT